FLKALAEGAALTPVEGKHRAVLRETGKGAVSDCTRNPRGRGFARHRREEGAKITPACRRACGRSENNGAKQDRSRPQGVHLLDVVARLASVVTLTLVLLFCPPWGADLRTLLPPRGAALRQSVGDIEGARVASVSV